MVVGSCVLRSVGAGCATGGSTACSLVGARSIIGDVVGCGDSTGGGDCIGDCGIVCVLSVCCGEGSTRVITGLVVAVGGILNLILLRICSCSFGGTFSGRAGVFTISCLDCGSASFAVFAIEWLPVLHTGSIFLRNRRFLVTRLLQSTFTSYCHAFVFAATITPCDAI